MNLYIRHREKGVWITFLHSIDEFNELEANYIPGRRLVIGDLSLFSKSMLNKLLKFIEENHNIDCFTSKDIDDPILMSRFRSVFKEGVIHNVTHSLEDYQKSTMDYQSSMELMSGWSLDAQLKAPLLPHNKKTLLNEL